MNILIEKYLKESARMIEACIFDLDGVIVDTAKYHFQSWKRMAESLGGSLTLEQNEKLKGVSRVGSLNFILDENKIVSSEREKLKLAALKNEWYLELISEIDEKELLPGIQAMFDELKSLGIKIGLGSASKNATTILKTIGIDHYFEVFVDGNMVTKSKPDPEVFLKGAEGLKVKPENCIVFEDSEKGIEAANSANFLSIGIGEEKNLPEAILVYPGFEDLTFQRLKVDLASKLS